MGKTKYRQDMLLLIIFNQARFTRRSEAQGWRKGEQARQKISGSSE